MATPTGRRVPSCSLETKANQQKLLGENISKYLQTLYVDHFTTLDDFSNKPPVHRWVHNGAPATALIGATGYRGIMPPLTPPRRLCSMASWKHVGIILAPQWVELNEPQGSIWKDQAPNDDACMFACRCNEKSVRLVVFFHPSKVDIPSGKL